MKFGALVYKEIRECLPYMLGAALLLIAFGFTMVQITVNPDYIENRYTQFSNINVNQWGGYYLFRASLIQPAGVWAMIFSVALGIALAIRQYSAEFFVRTWGFLLHRSVNRGTILASKLFAGLLSFIPLIIIWGLFYLYAHDKRYFPIPPTGRIFAEGLIFVAFGYISYLAIAMAALNKAKWYTTKKLSIAFGIWMFVTLMVQWQPFWGWITIIIAAAILLVQIIDTFLNREFE
jgi:ABC-type transport system involved in multi-copper enzyme maturation permease subunit